PAGQVVTRGGSMVATATLNEEAVRRALRQVKDPELDMNIVDLGLVYDVEVTGGDVRIAMTLTSPGCPAGPMITNDVYKVVRPLDARQLGLRQRQRAANRGEQGLAVAAGEDRGEARHAPQRLMRLG